MAHVPTTMAIDAEARPEGVTCVIPVYNEAESIAATLEGVAAALDARDRRWEIIVVDDASTDDSAERARAGGVDFRLIRHERNRGYGAAVKTGALAAEHPWILIIDADQTYPPEEIHKLLDELDRHPNVEMVVGRRRQTAATDPPTRLAGKAVLLRLANFLSGERIPDLNSGLRLMRRAQVMRYRPLLPDGFSLTTSITLALMCSGMPVHFVPIEYRHRAGQSKIRPLRDMWNFTTLIMRTIIYFNPLKVFVPLAGFLVATAIAVVILSKWFAGEVMDVTALFLFISGLQMLLIGVVADLMLKISGLREP